jgi:hypothetical protein
MFKTMAYKIRTIHEFCLPDWEARSQWCRWLQAMVINDSVTPEFMFPSKKAQFISSFYVESYPPPPTTKRHGFLKSLYSS